MQIFGIGPLELLLIIVIMLVLLGPKDMIITARKIGEGIRKIVRSPMWSTIMQTTKEVREIPGKFIQEAGLEQDLAQIKEVSQTPTQIINDTVKQLSVEIEPITLPPTPPAASILSTSSLNPQPVVTVQPYANNTSSESGKPLEVESMPFSFDVPAKPLPVTQEYNLSETTPVNTDSKNEILSSPATELPIDGNISPINQSSDDGKKGTDLRRTALRSRRKKSINEGEQNPADSSTEIIKQAMPDIPHGDNGSGPDG